MLYWLQAEMWGKHFAISIVFIGKWNQERAKYESTTMWGHTKLLVLIRILFLYYYAQLKMYAKNT